MLRSFFMPITGGTGQSNFIANTSAHFVNLAPIGVESILTGNGQSPIFQIGGTADVNTGIKTFALWFLADTLVPAIQDIFSKDSGLAPGAEYLLRLYSNGDLGWIGSNGTVYVEARQASGVVINTWKLAVCQFFRGGGFNTTVAIDTRPPGISTTNVLAGPVPSTNTVFEIGDAIANQPFFGRVDKFGIWNRSLSGGDILAYFNGGNGLTLGQFTPSLMNGLVSYHELDEKAGFPTRFDSVNPDGNLTQQGFVGNTPGVPTI